MLQYSFWCNLAELKILLMCFDLYQLPLFSFIEVYFQSLCYFKETKDIFDCHYTLSFILTHKQSIIHKLWHIHLYFVLPNLYPFKFIFWTTCLTNLAKPSTTIKNKSRTNGSPRLNPLVGINVFVELPFTNTKIEAESKHPIIHLIHLGLNPNISIT